MWRKAFSIEKKQIQYKDVLPPLGNDLISMKLTFYVDDGFFP